MTDKVTYTNDVGERRYVVGEITRIAFDPETLAQEVTVQVTVNYTIPMAHVEEIVSVSADAMDQLSTRIMD